MSLFKQMALSISLFLLIVLVTIMFLNLQSSQKFIQDQLHSSAEDTASSLALALSGVLGKETETSEMLSEMDTMISAIFDRGYYETIRLKKEGKVVIEKHQDILVKDVPSWFVTMATLKADSASSDVSGGWNAFGSVEVTSHVGHAHIQLWNIFTDLIETFSLLALLFLLLIGTLLKIILGSLTAVEAQAKAIESHDFHLNEKLPFTTEFKHVVSAMNSMVGKVKVVFDKEAEALKKYYELLYTDSITKLYNRRYLLIRINSCLEADSMESQGSFILFSFNDLQRAKLVLGYVGTESLLVLLSEKLQNYAKPFENAVVARMNNSDFALLLPQVELPLLKDTLVVLIKNMQQLFKDTSVDAELRVSAGAISFSPKDSPKTLFARADFELSKAKIKEENVIEFGADDEKEGICLGKEEWMGMFNASLEEHMLKVASQKVCGIDERGEVLHEELFLRMIDKEGHVHAAGHFMPMLVDLKLTDSVDRHVVTLALHYMKKKLIESSVAINISAHFLKSPENIAWLESQISQFSKQSALLLNFEATRFAVIHNRTLFALLSSLLKKYGYTFGIDNFSIEGEGLEYLKELKPAYIKASAGFYLDLNKDHNSTAGDSLSILSGSLGIRLIATAVETEDEMRKLKAMGIHYVQGSAVDKPEIIGV